MSKATEDWMKCVSRAKRYVRTVNPRPKYGIVQGKVLTIARILYKGMGY